jgi:hypothetical protein
VGLSDALQHLSTSQSAAAVLSADL